MRDAIKFFMILLILAVILVAWVTHQLTRPDIQAMIAGLILLGTVVFIVLNIGEQREIRARRKQRERPEINKEKHIQGKYPVPGTSYSLKDKKSGLTWGGGNIKASEAKRGTRRKFLGR